MGARALGLEPQGSQQEHHGRRESRLAEHAVGFAASRARASNGSAARGQWGPR